MCADAKMCVSLIPVYLCVVLLLAPLKYCLFLPVCQVEDSGPQMEEDFGDEEAEAPPEGEEEEGVAEALEAGRRF